jgi:hypothetical protein
MPCGGGRRRVLRTAAPALAALFALLPAACGGSSHGAAAKAQTATDAAAVAVAPAAEAPCGAAAGRTAARAAGEVAERIYQTELSSSEVRSDQHQVESFQPLLSALASGNRAGVREAVRELVYSHTHVVRLRVTRGSELLADIGGPYIIAPVGGSLRSGGRTVGHYELSVQDDLGYVKLENRFVAAPLLLRVQGRRVPVEGNLAAAGVPRSGPYSYRGRSYEVYSFPAKAYPNGTLDVSLLVPVPRPSTAGCRAVRMAELATVAENVWHRFSLVGAPASSYVTNNAQLTRALTFVRAGGRQLAGTGSGPAHLPASGSVRYRGRTYDVRSFSASAGGESGRVYLLFAA